MPHAQMKGYYTVGIDTQVPWPRREAEVAFGGRNLRLLPATDTSAPMVRVETAPGFNQTDAQKLVLELLSALAWAEQASASTTYGVWATGPVGVGNGRVGIIGDGHYDYVPSPSDPRAKLALALYREGLSVNHIPYQFLGFFKVINILFNDGKGQKQWIRDNLLHVRSADALKRLGELQAAVLDVGDYLYASGRCAVAHAYDQNVVNPDDPTHLVRLLYDLPVIRELAHIAIERELGVPSSASFHAAHLYELEGFRSIFGASLIARIKALEVVDGEYIPVPRTLALRLRDRDRLPPFESLQVTLDDARDGCVRLRLVTPCRRVTVHAALDFACERLVTEPLTGLLYHDDGTLDAAAVLLSFLQLFRWWYGGNGLVELWDTATGTRLARGQYYLPPVNARFPDEKIDAMERELRARTAGNDLE